MKRLLFSLLALLAILFAVDRLLGRELAVRFRVSPSDEADAIGRGIAARAPVLICGSSRARHHYDPDTLAARLGVSAWNLGLDGQFGPYYPYAVAEMALRRYTPKLWILEVDERAFAGGDPLASLNVLLPYAREDAAVAELVNRRSRYEWLKRLSDIYPYNSLVLNLFVPSSGLTRRGYEPMDGVLSPLDTLAAGPAVNREAEASDAPPAMNPLKLHYLRKMIGDLESRGVTVLAVRSPRFLRSAAERDRERRAGRRVAQVLDSLGVRFIDLSALTCPALGAPGLFRDPSHLNRVGATRFTEIVADSILALRLPALPAQRP